MSPLIQLVYSLILLLVGSLLTGNAAVTNTIAPGQVIGGRISAPAQTNFYTFTGTSNEVIFLTGIRTNGPGNIPEIILYAPDGTFVIAPNNFDYAELRGHRLTKSGTYTIAIFDDGRDETFGYALGLTVIGAANLREPGDGALAIVPGQITGGRITAADVDTYTFTGTSNEVIFLTGIRTNGPGNIPEIILYAPDGTFVIAPNNFDYAELRGHRLTKSGTYTIAIFDDGRDETFGYALGLTVIGAANLREPGDGALAIVPGQITGGRITAADVDTYTFTGTSNEVIFLTGIRTNGPGNIPEIILYAPDGTFVIAPNNFDYAELRGHRLTKSGTYTIAIFDDGRDETFGYALGLTVIGAANLREPGDGALAIVPGQITGGRITAADVDTYTFTGTSNEVIFLTGIRTNGPGNIPEIILYAPDGTFVIAPNNFDYAELRGHRLTKSGTYTIAIFDDGRDETFGYALGLTVIGAANLREPGDGALAIVPGQITGGRITAADVDTYTFTGTSNEVIFLTGIRTNGPGNIPEIILYAPDGTFVIAPNNFDYAELRGHRLTKSGTYTIAIFDDGRDETFGYALGLTVIGAANLREPGDGALAIVPGQITGGRITAADVDTYTFTGTSNEVIFLTGIRTNGPGNIPEIILYAPDGTFVIAPNNFDYAELRGHRLTKSGTYTIAIFDDGRDETFGYALGLTVIGAANLREPGDGALAIVPGQITGGRITAADVDTYTFTGTSNEVIFLTGIRTNGPGNIPEIILYAPDGTFVIAPNNFDYAELRGHRLTKSGTYTIAIFDDGRDETFGYALTLIKIPGLNATDPGEGAYALSPVESRNGQLSPGDLDAFGIEAIAGDTLDVSLRITSGSGRFPVLSVYGPDGNIVDTDSSSTKARVRLQCVKRTGPYTVVIHDDGRNEAYNYSLTFNQFPVVPASDGLTQYLAVCDCTNRAVVRWDTSAQPLGFVLESSQAVDGGISPGWSPVTGPFQINAGRFYFTDAPTNGTKFYRLRKPE